MPDQMNPLALPAGDVIRILGRSGCPEMSDDILQKLMESGLPLNGDGTINIIEIIAWLLKEVQGYGYQPSAT